MKKNNFFYSILILLFTINCTTYSLAKEVVYSTTSLSFYKKNDSLLLKYKKAKKNYDKKEFTKSLRIALEILKNENLNQNLLCKINFLIANIFYNTHDAENAIKYYTKVQEFYESQINSTNETIIIKKNIKLNLELNQIYLESLLKKGTFFLKLSYEKKIKKYRDSSFYYFNRIIENSSEVNNYKEFKAKAYGSLSGVYMNDSLYDKAKVYAFRAVKIHKELNDKTNQAISLGNLSSIYLLEEDFNKAKEIYFEAIDLIKDINTDKALKVREDLYYNLAWNLYKLKDYTAYDYQELSYLIKDSIRDKQFRGIIAEINQKYNLEVQEKLLKEEAENRVLKEQRSFWVATITGVLIIFSLLYWMNFYKLKQKNLGLKLSQTELLQNQKLEKLKSESQTRILNATIDGKETERKQIAETLHDSVSALLSSANLHLQATKTVFNGKAPIEIDKTREIITEASHKIRDLSHSLVSSVLLKFGLKFAIKDMAKKYSNSQIKITTDFGSVRRYEQDFEIKIHNITQEFLNNILKHSQATEAKIQLKEKGKKLFLKVTDNGKGFDKTKVINKDGLGINQIEARIIVMKGKFVIDSKKGKGTSILVEIPVEEKEVMHHA